MSNVATTALELWGIPNAKCKLVATRENQIFRIEHNQDRFALRIHRPNYRTDNELWSELQWMAALRRGGMNVPTPVPSLSGEFLQVVEGLQIDMLTWLPGAPLGQTGAALDVKNSVSVFQKIGHEMARLHDVSDSWSIPSKFTRSHWNRAGLVGENPVWGKFWENPTLDCDDKVLFQRLKNVTDKHLEQLEDSLDYGLIHADLVRENVMINNAVIQFIDFDDGGFGFRLFDLATALIKNLDEPKYPEIRNALITGYRNRRKIDITELDLFIVLRAATYVGWVVKRLNEDGAKTRNERFISKTRQLASSYLATRPD